MHHNCQFCNQSDTYKHLLIKRYKYWRLELGCNQYFLGKCLLILNRHEEDLMNITLYEQKELFQISKHVRDILKELFQPDKFNYSSLGNEENHVHWHVVPRYKQKRLFESTVFEDKIWGRNYAHYDKSFSISREIENKIVLALKKRLNI